MIARFAWLLALSVGCAGSKQVSSGTALPGWVEDRDSVRYELIEHFLDADDASRALEVIRVMREELGEDARLDMYQGEAFRKQGMLADSERLLTAARAKRPRDPQVHAQLCIVYADQRKMDEAVSACSRSVTLDDSQPDVWNNVGFLYLGQERYPDAVDALQRAVDLDGTVVRYRNNLAIALVCSGMADRGLNMFLTMHSRADANYNVGVALERIGARDEAMRYYEAAVEYDAKHENALAALALDSVD
jgi:Flp pilus assembly protein TadD